MFQFLHFVWMTRSSVLCNDGKSGLFLQALQTRHPLSRSRSHTCATTTELQTHCLVSSLTATAKTGIHYLCLTLKKSPHLLSPESDLLTRTFSAQASRNDFVKINFSLVVTRQVAPIWLTRCLLGSWVGALLLVVLDRVFLCARKKK